MLQLLTASALALSPSLITPAHGIYFFQSHRPTAHQGGQIILSELDRPPWRPPTDLPTRNTPFPPPQAQKLVKPLLGNVSTDRMYDDLKNLTDFHTRHFPSKEGRKSQLWLLDQVKQIANSYGGNGLNVTVTEFQHEDFAQQSIIAHIQGSNVTYDNSLVIIGAHQDSKNYKFPEERSPGADDDGSGTVTLLEALRVLAQAKYAPARSVELHWYAAEEGGLYGSRDLVAKYKEDGKQVAAMTQYDATAWVKNGTDEVIGIVSSDTDLGLVSFHVQLVNEYLDLPSAVFRLAPNAGSDHMPWHWEGYTASYLAESLFENMNPHFHTPDDRMDISPEFSFEHMRRFTQHAIAFIVEIAGGEHTLAKGAK